MDGCVWNADCLLMCISEEFDKETGQMLSGLDKLPPDLKEYVEGDNKLFEREMEEWDALQARKLQQEKLALASVAAQPMSTEPCPQDNTGEPSLWTYCLRQPSLTVKETHSLLPQQPLSMTQSTWSSSRPPETPNTCRRTRREPSAKPQLSMMRRVQRPCSTQ